MRIKLELKDISTLIRADAAGYLSVQIQTVLVFVC